jgi:acetolactate synthase-1/2/3 large subunit
VAGDLSEVLNKLCENSEKRTHAGWVKKVSSLRRSAVPDTSDAESMPDPLYILQTLRELTDDDTIIATDVGQHQMWTAQHFEFRKPRTFLTSGGLGTMGYGLGAAIGAHYAQPDRKVVLISGDGSFHMNLNELTTLASYNLPIVVLVMNNTVLGMVRQWQKVFYGSRFSSTDPHRKTDIVKLAEAFGCSGMRITKTGEVESVIKAALADGGPVIVDCRISPDANVLPMIPPGGTVKDVIEEM